MSRSKLFRQFARLFQTSLPSSSEADVSSSPLSRRHLLQYSAVSAVVGTGASSPNLTAPLPVAQKQPTIAIIGGGIAGLNAAYQLKKAGLTAIVYEAKSQVGGRIQSQSTVSEGLINDLGATFINREHADILTLVDELGLTLHDCSAAPQAASTAYYFEGRAIDEAELAEALRPLASQIAEDAARLNQDFERYGPGLDRLSVQTYLDLHADKISEPYVRSLIENSIRTEYGVEPDQSSALQLLSNLPSVAADRVTVLASDEALSLKGGSTQLIKALSAQLSGQIQTNCRLTRLQSAGEGFLLTFEDAPALIKADYVIMAIPFQVLRRVDLQVPLPQGLQHFIQTVDLGCNEKLFAGFKQRSWQHAFIHSAWSDQAYSQIWDDTQRQPDSQAGVLTFLLGGEQAAELTQPESQQTLYSRGNHYLNTLASILPSVKQTATGRFFQTAWADDPDIGGGYTTFKPGQYRQFRRFMYVDAAGDSSHAPQNIHVGNLAFAGEHLSQAFYGYMNGAAQTGRLAAGVVMQRMAQAPRQSYSKSV